MQSRHIMLTLLFQSTLPYGSDAKGFVVVGQDRNFNPRSLTGATSLERHCWANLKFQSTLPYGSDAQDSRCHRQRLPNFNPRSLTGATQGAQIIRNAFIISIHAPLRERPYHLLRLRQKAHISIHAPLRERQLAHFTLPLTQEFQSTLPYGSDRYRYSYLNHLNVFQSTLPYGSDLHSALRAIIGITISIHAPLRERLKLTVTTLLFLLFQSTLPYGSDPLMTLRSLSALLFQSTLPYGSDFAVCRVGFTSIISIHAPLRERPF